MELYAKKHGGQIITNFDERRPFLADAPLSYQRLAAKAYDRNLIQIICRDGGRLADRIDRFDYNNYGQVGAMGANARSDSDSSGHLAEGGTTNAYNNFGQVGAMGENARSDRNHFVQQAPAVSIDVAELAKQLAGIRAEMKKQADPGDAAHDAEIGNLAQAEQAVKSGDLPTALELLRNAGTWTLSVAKSVVASLVTDAIEGKLHL